MLHFYPIYVTFLNAISYINILHLVDKMSVRISLTLEASEMLLSLHMNFSLESAAVAWAILERISVFFSFFKDYCSQVLEVLHFFLPLTFYLDLSLEAIWVVCYHFRLVWTDLHFVPWGRCIETVYQDASFFFLFCIFTTMSPAKQKLVISRPPIMDIKFFTHDSL